MSNHTMVFYSDYIMRTGQFYLQFRCHLTIVMNLNTESKNFINQNTGRIQIRTVIIFLLGAFHVKSKPGIGYHHTSLDETKFRRSGVPTQ